MFPAQTVFTHRRRFRPALLGGIPWRAAAHLPLLAAGLQAAAAGPSALLSLRGSSFLARGDARGGGLGCGAGRRGFRGVGGGGSFGTLEHLWAHSPR